MPVWRLTVSRSNPEDMRSNQFLTCTRIKLHIPSHQKLLKINNRVHQVEILHENIAQLFPSKEFTAPRTLFLSRASSLGVPSDRIRIGYYLYHIHIRTQSSDTDTDTDIGGCGKMISVSAKIGY